MYKIKSLFNISVILWQLQLSVFVVCKCSHLVPQEKAYKDSTCFRTQLWYTWYNMIELTHIVIIIFVYISHVSLRVRYSSNTSPIPYKALHSFIFLSQNRRIPRRLSTQISDSNNLKANITNPYNAIKRIAKLTDV